MPKNSKPKCNRVFNLFEDGPALVVATKEAMAAACARLKRDPGPMFNTLDQQKRVMVPITSFPLAWLLDSRGLISGTVFDIIGGDGVGKTSLIFTLIGCGMAYGCPALYVESENKQMLDIRTRQCLSSDKALAQKMFDSLTIVQ